MRKTASQIAEAVLKKLATSRWREAIRSGELAPREAETLKTRMGVDPMREARGLSKGWRGIAGYHGYVPMTQIKSEGPIRPVEGSTPIDSKRHKAIMQPLRELKELGPHTYIGRGPSTRYTYVPHHAGEFVNETVQFVRNPEQELRKYRKLGPNFTKFEKPTKAITRLQGELTGLTAGHEGSEIAEGMKGIRKERIHPRTGAGAWRAGHYSPRVILEEIRNARMLSPTVRNAMLDLRRMDAAPELSSVVLQVPTKQKTNQLQLPRHHLERYSNKILKTPLPREIVRDPAYGSKHLRKEWFEKLLRRVRRIR